MNQTTLFALHKNAGAEFIEFAGYEIPNHFGDAIAEYQAIRQTAGIIDLSYRGRMEFTGQERITFLQSICSNDVKATPAGNGLEAGFLTTMGKVVSYGRLFVADESVLFDTDQEAQEPTSAYLEKYIKLSRSEMRDARRTLGHLSVQGPRSNEIIAALTGKDVGSFGNCQHFKHELASQSALIAKVSHTGETGFDIFIASDSLTQLWSLLLEQGNNFAARPVGFAALNTARLEAGIPLYNVDYNANHILVEANFHNAVSYTKGCYLGQEIIARLHYRGHVAKRLALLEIDAPDIPNIGDPVFREIKNVGQITSAVHSPMLNKPLAHAFLRYDPSQLGVELSVETNGKKFFARVIAAPKAS